MKIDDKIALFLGFVLALGAAACGKKEAVLAKVGGEKVTAAEFEREMAARPFADESYLASLPGRREFLELLVRRKVLLAESRRAHYDQKDEVKAKLEALDAQFARQHAEARERLLIGEYLRTLQENEFKVTDEEVARFFETQTEAKASHILVSTKEKAEEAAAEIAKGAAFEAAAKKFSEDPTGQAGGDLGYFIRGTLAPDFERAVFALKNGGISGVVSSPYGYHIVKKTGERKLAERPKAKGKGRVQLADVQDEIRKALEQQKFHAWLENKRRQLKISVDLPALEKLGARPVPQEVKR